MNLQHRLPEPIRHQLQALAEKRSRIMCLPPEKALNELLSDPNGVALVRSFPEEDLFLLIHEIGPEDALPLITLASNRQWQFFVDMEVWDHDRIHPQRFARWMHLLLQADAERFIQWTLAEHLETMERFLFLHTDLFILEHDGDPSDFPEDTFTLDGTYYIRFRKDLDVIAEKEASFSDIESFLNEFLTYLSDHDSHITFQNLLLESRWILPSEIEEEAYRLRTVRLAEKGFLPYEQAISIYQPLQPERILPRTRRRDPSLPLKEEPSIVPSILVHSNQYPIDISLDALRDDPLFTEILTEIGALANQIAVADRIHPTSRDDLSGLIRKVRAYLGIGIEVLSGEPFHPRTAPSYIRRYPISAIFRIGYAQVMTLHRKLVLWMKKSWFRKTGFKLDFWTEPGMAILGGMLLPRPKFYDPYQGDSHYREFLSMQEIISVQEKLQDYILLDSLLGKLCPPVSSRFLQTSETEQWTYQNLLLTLYAASRLHLSLEDTPIDPDRFRSFYQTLWADPNSTGQKRLSTSFEVGFFQWLSTSTDCNPEELQSQLGHVFRTLFQDIETELGGIASDRIDPRFIHLFRIGKT